MRVRDFGESDLLISFFTQDKGRLKGVAKGARRSRRRFVNCLDVFCLTALEYEERRRGDLHFLHSGKLVNGFPGLRSDFFSLSLAAYMVELTETLFPLGVADQEMFNLLSASLSGLDGGEAQRPVRVRFEARSMRLGGYGIGLERCCRCGRAYAGKGRAVFLSDQGGIACGGCARETASTPGLAPVEVAGLNALQGAQSGVPPLSEKVMDALTPVLQRHILYRLGREFRAGNYLNLK